MSEIISFASGDVTIYGTLEGARGYLGPERDEWDLASDSEVTTDMQRALVKALRFLDRLAWAPAYDTFAERDAVQAIVNASYELAALVYDDSEALAASQDTDVVTSISAGGDSVTYAVGAKRSSVPAPALSLLLPYLSTAVDDAALDGSAGQEGCTVNPFSLRLGDEDCCP